MPREYITRLVLDRKHRTMIALKRGRVVGGICYRPFFKQHFAEIAFCAVTSSEQVRGYGTMLMCHLKQAVKRDAILNMLTYADNFAIGYFSKQGFTKDVDMEPRRWKGFIKDYDGGTLMQCTIHPAIDYANAPHMVAQQRAYVLQLIAAVQNGLCVAPSLRARTTKKLPASVKSAASASKPGKPSQREFGRVQAQLNRVIKDFVARVKEQDSAWPFEDPVDVTEVSDYFDVIDEATDLSKITRQAKSGRYKNFQAVLDELALMTRNCKTYNAADTEYHKTAIQMEKFVQEHAQQTVEEHGDWILSGDLQAGLDYMSI